MLTNIEYCPRCGGVTRYVELNPTAAASVGPPLTVDARMAMSFMFANATATAPITTNTMRICGCPRPSEATGGL